MTDHILVPLDGSRVAESAVPHAAALASLFDARITLVRVPEPMVVPVASGGVWITHNIETPEAAERAREELAALTASPLLAGLVVDWMVPDLPVVEALLDTIEEIGADLVVMTSHGRSAAGRWVFGSVAQKLVRTSPAPVYVVRAPEGAFEDPDGFPLPEPPAFERIVVPLDGSELAESALGPAGDLARASGGEVRLVTVPTVPGYLKIMPETAGAIPEALLERTAQAESYLEGVAERLEGEGLSVDADVEIMYAGGVPEGILEYAQDEDADVLIMTSHGRSGVGRWLVGSVAERLLAASSVPVWIVHARS